MKTDKEMKKEGRGSYDERVSQNDEVVLVRWQDNGTVNMASTHLGVGNIGTVRRWSESQKVHVDIDCPEVVLDYNKYMGGVDKLDFIMSLYPMRTRTKKWPVRVISHFASFALSNSWLEYLRDANKAGLLRKETLDMMAFQTDVANCLLNSNKPQKKRGRPSNDNSRTVKKKVPNASPLPVITVRYDGINHWPQQVNMANAQRCRREECTSKSRVRCRKCNIFLCLTSQNDCFYLFHTK